MKGFCKFFEVFMCWFVYFVENFWVDMFGSDFEVVIDVVIDEFLYILR